MTLDTKPLPKPRWLKAPLPGGTRYKQVRAIVAQHQLATVCQEARCPNLGECWNQGTATFMILGKVCTRGCRFCAVERGTSGHTDVNEPAKVAAAAQKMGLDYVVVTSVTRDDLPDGGADHFAQTINALRQQNDQLQVEVLTADYLGAPLQTVLQAGPTVFAHNIEVVERLSASLRHQRFSYRRSLETLRQAVQFDSSVITKSSIMLGLGETPKEVHRSIVDIYECGVQLLVLGQYLQPTPEHATVEAYISPAVFDEYAQFAKELGFSFVASAPLARTSYRAAEAYIKSRHNE